MGTKTIYLIRHAQPDYPGGEKMCLGQKNDLPLSAYGFEQAAMLGSYFRDIPLEAVYTSPLLRARQTAAAVAGQSRPVCALDSLIELYGGEWDGMPFREVRSRYPQYFVRGSGFSCPPGGETDEKGLSRALDALDHVRRQTKVCSAMVAHSGVNRLLLCALTRRPLSEKRQLSQNYAAVNIIRDTDGVLTVDEIGLTPDLLLSR